MCVSLARRPERAEPWEPAASMCRCVSSCVVACEGVYVPMGETLRVISCTHPSTYFSFYRKEGQVQRRGRARPVAQGWDSWLPNPEPVSLCVQKLRASPRVPQCMGPTSPPPYTNLAPWSLSTHTPIPQDLGHSSLRREGETPSHQGHD